jgi:formylmethanofuran dehydrogenase subunit C
MIRLSLAAPPSARLSLAGILPERLAGLGERELRALPVLCGNRRMALGAWFSVAIADGAADCLVVSGGSDRLDDVGAGMSSGEIRVEGSVGAALGAGMSGGRVSVAGSAAAGAAMAMRGGELHIGGDAGDQLGGALPGERAGMSGGKVVVRGAAGSGVGDRMRRGLIVVAGSVGALCGARMTAGTIVVGGAMGSHPGVAMRRGTIVALAGGVTPPASFAWSGRHELAFALLLAQALDHAGLERVLPRLARLERWVGDLATGGRGEILAAS